MPHSNDSPLRHPAFGAVIAGLAAAVLGGLLWYNRAPTNARAWTPEDHDQPPSAEAAAQPGGPKRGPKPAGGGGGENLVELAWGKNCAPCHGERGRGDGPQGAMVQAGDLTNPDWQGRVSDAEIATTIRKGRNKMPAFDLPPNVIEGLVKRIRGNRRP